MLGLARIVAVSSAAFASLIASAPASAAPISYFESIGGDLPQTGSPLPTFVLDSGLNTVNGNTTAFTATDGDSFAFTVPAGLEVFQGKLTMIDISGTPTSASWLFRSGSANFNTGSLIGSWTSLSPGFANMPGAPLAPNTYSVSADFLVGSGTMNYTFTFDVHPIVPEPTSLGLLALGSLALFRRPNR